MATGRKKQPRYQSDDNSSRTRKQLSIKARNDNQQQYINAIKDNDITFGVGSAGSGKTYVAALLAVKQLTNGHVDKIVICRPAIPAGGEDIGFLPGSIDDKMAPYIQSIFDAFKTYWRPQTIKQHLADGTIEIVPLAFMRGRSFTNTYILCDEMQNATMDNMLMLLTRLGDGSKMVITGDPIQSDIHGTDTFTQVETVLRDISGIAFVNFTNDDVIRHQTVMNILNAWPVHAAPVGVPIPVAA